MMNKRRYEYCSETQMIIDNMLGNYVEDVVDRLNTQDRNKNDLYKQYNLLENEIRVLKKALELAVESWCIMDNPCDPKDVVKEYIKRAKEMLKDEENH